MSGSRSLEGYKTMPAGILDSSGIKRMPGSMAAAVSGSIGSQNAGVRSRTKAE